jgi:hypothetical protein
LFFFAWRNNGPFCLLLTSASATENGGLSWLQKGEAWSMLA